MAHSTDPTHAIDFARLTITVVDEPRPIERKPVDFDRAYIEAAVAEGLVQSDD